MSRRTRGTEGFARSSAGIAGILTAAHHLLRGDAVNSRIAQRIDGPALLCAVAIALGGAAGCGGRSLQDDGSAGAGGASLGGRGAGGSGAGGNGGIAGSAGGAAGAGRRVRLERRAAVLSSRQRRHGRLLRRLPHDGDLFGRAMGLSAGAGCSDTVPVSWSRLPDVCLRERRLAVRDRRRGRAERRRWTRRRGRFGRWRRQWRNERHDGWRGQWWNKRHDGRCELRRIPAAWMPARPLRPLLDCRFLRLPGGRRRQFRVQMLRVGCALDVDGLQVHHERPQRRDSHHHQARRDSLLHARHLGQSLAGLRVRDLSVERCQWRDGRHRNARLRQRNLDPLRSGRRDRDEVGRHPALPDLHLGSVFPGQLPLGPPRGRKRAWIVMRRDALRLRP